MHLGVSQLGLRNVSLQSRLSGSAAQGLPLGALLAVTRVPKLVEVFVLTNWAVWAVFYCWSRPDPQAWLW